MFSNLYAERINFCAGKTKYSFLKNNFAKQVSFDGCSVFRPWVVDNKWRTSAGWWHFDCSKNVPAEINVDGLPDCIQGAVSFDKNS